MKINNLTDLHREMEQLQYKIAVDKEKLRSDMKFLKYQVFEDLLKKIKHTKKK